MRALDFVIVSVSPSFIMMQWVASTVDTSVRLLPPQLPTHIDAGASPNVV